MKLIEVPTGNGATFGLGAETKKEETFLVRNKNRVLKYIKQWQDGLSLDFNAPYDTLVQELILELEKKFKINFVYKKEFFQAGDRPKVTVGTRDLSNGDVEIVCYTTITFRRVVSKEIVDDVKKELADEMICAIHLVEPIAEYANRA